MFGSKIVSFDAAKVSGMPGVRHVVKVNATAVAVVADTWWQAKKAVEALPVTYEDSPNSKVSSASIAEHLKEGLTAQEVARRQRQRRCAGGHRRRRQEDRGRLLHAVPQPRLHGADELHGELHARALRGVVADAERRGLARGRVGGVRPAARQVRGLQDRSRRRLRPARRRAGLRAPGGADRQAGPGRAGQADLVARGGHDARLLPADLAVPAGGRPRCRQQPGRPAHARLRPVDQRLRQPGIGRPTARTTGSCRATGGARRCPARLHRAEPADRVRHAQHARAGRPLARRQHQPERRLSRVLHGRGRARRRPDPLEFRRAS